MTNPQRSLHDALARATEAIEAPALAGTALREARRRRTRRRGVAAAALSSGLVVAVLVATNVGGSTSVAPPPTNPSVPTSTSTPAPPAPVEQPTWDPDKAPDLPAAAPELAPTVPDVIEPPSASPLLSEEPIEAAVVVVEVDGVAQLLSTQGEWRSVPLTQQYPSLQLSPGGTRLSVTYCCGDEGATIVDLSTGESRVLPFPTDFRPSDFTFWTFVDEVVVFLHESSTESYLVDAASGAAVPVDHGADGFDNAGAALESDCCTGPRVLVDWASGTRREVRLGELGRLTNLHADGVSVVANSDLGVTVADRQTLTPVAVLPTVDRTGTYGDGGEPSVLALTDDGTVLLRVNSRSGFRVVAWDSGAGSLSLVTTSPPGVAFAPGLLGATAVRR